MARLGSLLRRSAGPPADPGALLALADAAAGFEAASGLRPVGTASLCLRPVSDNRAEALQGAVESLTSSGERPFTDTVDEFGHRWLTRRTDPPDVARLVADLHAAHLSVTAAGVGAAALCSLVGFTDGDRQVALVYLNQRGSWYPFVPTGDMTRDSPRELELRGMLGGLNVESDLRRWRPLWGAPGL
jgi:hypothetical protein